MGDGVEGEGDEDNEPEEGLPVADDDDVGVCGAPSYLHLKPLSFRDSGAYLTSKAYTIAKSLSIEKRPLDETPCRLTVSLSASV